MLLKAWNRLKKIVFLPDDVMGTGAAANPEARGIRTTELSRTSSR